MLGSATHRISLGPDIKSVKNSDASTAIFDKNNSYLWQNNDEKLAHAKWVESEQNLAEANIAFNDTIKEVKQAKGEEDIRNSRQREIQEKGK